MPSWEHNSNAGAGGTKPTLSSETKQRPKIKQFPKLRMKNMHIVNEQSWMQTQTEKIPQNNKNSMRTIQPAETEWALWCSKEYVKSNGENK